jgi:DNA (cytosine-5)-methyltransferase 1
MEKNITIGSVCSGIEAASVSWKGMGVSFEWFSEISEFPSKVLARHFPHIKNLGDMSSIPEKLVSGEITSPDMVCGGTPCQAFSLAGWKRGLMDERGNLTLKFCEIIESNDQVRNAAGLPPTIVFWENVEGVLKDKTNPFGCFLASLAGFEDPLPLERWPVSGFIYGPKRNVAWRVLDAKYFGLPQQRRRLYLLAGGKDFNPEQILFERVDSLPKTLVNNPLTFEKSNNKIEVFRSYTDCLYSAYGTKWNGNAAAYNGSLYVCQNERLRRFTPLECERLMGFPDDYTKLPSSSPTSRYQSLGNSWAVPVTKWIGGRIFISEALKNNSWDQADFNIQSRKVTINGCDVYKLGASMVNLVGGAMLNGSDMPHDVIQSNLSDVIDVNADERFYISPAGCKGILRRTEERDMSINSRLKEILESISSEWSDEEIEKISRVQTRGKFSLNLEKASLPEQEEFKLEAIV